MTIPLWMTVNSALVGWEVSVSNRTRTQRRDHSLCIALERMAIYFTGRTMSSPTGVSDGDLLKERLLLIDVGVGDEFLETSYFSYVFEEDDLTWCVSVDADT